MANIVTVQIRCFRTPNFTQRVKTKRMSRRVCPSGSYCIPTWSQDKLREGVVDFQFGSRWSASHSLSEGWFHLQELFTSMWVRSYDQGESIEYYEAYGATCSQSRGSMYGFNGLTLTLNDDALVDQWGPHFIHIAPGTWRNDQSEGKYHSQNPRLVWSDDLYLSTPSTPVALTYLNEIPNDLPRSIQTLLTTKPHRLKRLDLTWNGRLVKRIVNVQGELKQFPIDHWDNFLHPEYLTMLTRHQNQWRL